MAVKRKKYSLIYASKHAVPFKKDRPLQIMLLIYLSVFIFMAVEPTDYVQWWYMNIASVLIFLILGLFYVNSRLTNMAYASVLLFLLIHTVGAHYTYSQCPMGEWMKGFLGGGRNNYDRLVFLAFGLLISTPVMEILYHRFRLRYTEACLISILIIVAFCALNSLADMLVASFSSTRAILTLKEAQGDMWTSQRDIAMSLLGAVLNMGNCILIKIKRNQKIHMVKATK